MKNFELFYSLETEVSVIIRLQREFFEKQTFLF